MDKSFKKILFPAEVKDNEDPNMLGRIRAYPLDQKIRSALAAFDFDETKDKWGPNDPFIQQPLLPMFFSQVPLVGERVNIIYQNSFYPFQDQYYIQGAFSSPMSFPLETVNQANKYTSLGDRVRPSLSVKNTDGSYKKEYSSGVFPEPGDNAILGRGSADVIVKPDTVMMRAGKVRTLNPRFSPIGNSNRAFVQMSSYTTETVNGKEKNLINISSSNQQVLKLVEWDIDNLENQQNSFTGSIRLYTLKPVNKTLSDNIDFNSDLDDVKFLDFYENFIGLSFNAAVKRINNFITGVNNGQIPNGPSVTKQFPFAYRPNIGVRNVLSVISNKKNPIVFSNASKFTSAVTLNSGQGEKAFKFAIVRSKNQIGKPIKIELQTVTPKDTVPTFGTFGGMGADTLFLISHKSTKPIDLNGTLSGITQTDLIEKIIPNTSSMVRGEELIELINLIVQFLVSHVHVYPGVAPIPVGTDGTSTTDILFQLQNAANKILNPNIRVN